MYVRGCKSELEVNERLLACTVVTIHTNNNNSNQANLLCTAISAMNFHHIARIPRSCLDNSGRVLGILLQVHIISDGQVIILITFMVRRFLLLDIRVTMTGMNSRITEDLLQLRQVDIGTEGTCLTHAGMAKHNPHNCHVVEYVDADGLAATFDAKGGNRIHAIGEDTLPFFLCGQFVNFLEVERCRGGCGGSSC